MLSLIRFLAEFLSKNKVFVTAVVVTALILGIISGVVLYDYCLETLTNTGTVTRENW